MKKTTLLFLVALCAYLAACSSDTEEPVAAAGQNLCSAHRRMTLNEVYERPGGTCGIWPGEINGAAKNPGYFNLDTQIAFGSFSYPTRCTWMQAGSCFAFAGAVAFFTNTAFCQGFPEGWFYLDVQHGAGTVVHKYGGSCDSTYDAVVTKATY